MAGRRVVISALAKEGRSERGGYDAGLSIEEGSAVARGGVVNIHDDGGYTEAEDTGNRSTESDGHLTGPDRLSPERKWRLVKLANYGERYVRGVSTIPAQH